MKIVANAKELNKLHARVFAFGVGYDVNSRLLDKLVRENFGQSEYVRPNEDIEDRVSKLYNRIESPVMTGVQLAVRLRRDEDRGRPADQPRLSEGFLRSVRRRATRGGRAVPEAGHGQGDRPGHGGREPAEVSIFPPRWSKRATTKVSPSSKSFGPSAAWAKSSTSWTSTARTTNWSRNWSNWPRGTASSRRTRRSWPTKAPTSTTWPATRPAPAVGWKPRARHGGEAGFAPAGDEGRHAKRPAGRLLAD